MGRVVALEVVDGGAFAGVHGGIVDGGGWRGRVWPVVGIVVGILALSHHWTVTVVHGVLHSCILVARRGIGMLGFEAGGGRIPGGCTEVVGAEVVLGIEEGVDGRLFGGIVGVHWGELKSRQGLSAFSG